MRDQSTRPDWLDDSPVDLPANWLTLVNRPQTKAEEAAVRSSVTRGTPLGDPAWQRKTANQLGLEATLRPRGRPRIKPKPAQKK